MKDEDTHDDDLQPDVEPERDTHNVMVQTIVVWELMTTYDQLDASLERTAAWANGTSEGQDGQFGFVQNRVIVPVGFVHEMDKDIYLLH